MGRIGILALIVAALVFGAYEAITLYDDNLPVGRMWETPAIRSYEDPIPKMATGTIPVNGGEARYRNADGRTLIPPFDLKDPAVVALGQKGYFNYCVHCHGKQYDGNGTVGQSFAPLPGDLRSPKVQGMADGIIFQEVGYGVPNGRQPPLASTVSVPARWQIIAYLKSLGSRP